MKKSGNQRAGWIRGPEKSTWEQYVGRRVRRVTSAEGVHSYLAFCGNRYRGCYSGLEEAQEAAEQL